MSKIKVIEIKNFKAITEQTLNLNGCSGIITGRNNSGKSTLLRGIPDRIRGERPELIVKEGEKAGKGTMELTTGEKFLWEFDKDGKDKLTFITKEGIPVAVTKAIAARFFKPVFDIDQFLNSSPKDQAKQLQALLGIDFTMVDSAYKTAYDERTIANRTLATEKTKLEGYTNPIKVEPVDTTKLIEKKNSVRDKLNSLFMENKTKNNVTRSEWEKAKIGVDERVRAFNAIQDGIKTKRGSAIEAVKILYELGYDGNEVDKWIDKLGDPKEHKIASNEYPKEPEYIPEMPDDAEIKAIDEQINTATSINTQAQKYENYVAQKDSFEMANVKAEETDQAVKLIEAQKHKMIADAKLPSGIELKEEGIRIDGFPLDRNQISTSKLYCTALRLAALNLGEVKALHFDASTLDKNTLIEIEKWAEANDHQLMLEQVDREGGDISYELICSTDKATSGELPLN